MLDLTILKDGKIRKSYLLNEDTTFRVSVKKDGILRKGRLLALFTVGEEVYSVPNIQDGGVYNLPEACIGTDFHVCIVNEYPGGISSTEKQEIKVVGATVSSEEVQNAVDNYLTRNPVSGISGTVTNEQIASAVNTYLSENPISGIANPLNDMNVVLMGDSLTDEKVNGMWVQPFNELANPKTLTNYGRGYCTWTNSNDTYFDISSTENAKTSENVIWNQYNKLKNDVSEGNIAEPDLVIIFAGTNDAGQHKTSKEPSEVFMGSITPKANKLVDIASSIRFVVENLYYEYPNAKVVLVTPPDSTAEEYIMQTEVPRVREVIRECVSYLGSGLIDLEKSAIKYIREKQKKYFLRSDGIHFSEVGGKYVARFIFENLLNMPDIQTASLFNTELLTLAPERAVLTTLEICNSSVNVNNTITIVPTISPECTISYDLSYQSDDDSIATVNDNGVVTGISEGSVTITVTDSFSGLKATCTVNVLAEGEKTGAVYYASKCPTNGYYADDIQLTYDYFETAIKTYSADELYDGNEEGTYIILHNSKYGSAAFSTMWLGDMENCEVYVAKVTDDNKTEGVSASWVQLSDTVVSTVIFDSTKADVTIDDEGTKVSMQRFNNSSGYSINSPKVYNYNIYTNDHATIKLSKNYEQSDYE